MVKREKRVISASWRKIPLSCWEFYPILCINHQLDCFARWARNDNKECVQGTQPKTNADLSLRGARKRDAAIQSIKRNHTLFTGLLRPSSLRYAATRNDNKEWIAEHSEQ